jgi:hypothetical protein
VRFLANLVSLACAVLLLCSLGWTFATVRCRDHYRRMKHTMGDMLTVATAVDLYELDNNHYPHVSSITALRQYVEPTYIRELPTQDQWQANFVWSADTQAYTLVSLGADCRPGESMRGPTRTIDDDLIFSRGAFRTYPGGGNQGGNPPTCYLHSVMSPYWKVRQRSILYPSVLSAISLLLLAAGLVLRRPGAPADSP